MKFAIIAAGEGSRLQQEGVELPKPLVKVCGEALIDRLIRIFRKNNAKEIVIIVNQLNPLTEQHILKLKEAGLASDIRMVVKTTPSSMHSFAELAPYLENEEFCLTTVDTIFNEEEFAKYIAYFKTCNYDGCMAVTNYIDDEKPLYIGTDSDLNITGFYDDKRTCEYISGGIYCLRPNALSTLKHCLEQGISRMRNFQRALVTDGLQLKACPFSKILDVDHASDIAKAECFLTAQ
ncbi:MAG: NTP transferase domain-containing protein [Prevotellamassilia sp.]|nr:NTP transferase domain-containing protein [Prevotellamassilia sp.]